MSSHANFHSTHRDGQLRSTPQIVDVSDVATPGSCAGTFTRTKTWMAVDATGNASGTASQTITVQDTTPPTIQCPADKTVPASTQAGATVSFLRIAKSAGPLDWPRAYSFFEVGFVAMLVLETGTLSSTPV